MDRSQSIYRAEGSIHEVQVTRRTDVLGYLVPKDARPISLSSDLQVVLALTCILATNSFACDILLVYSCGLELHDPTVWEHEDLDDRLLLLPLFKTTRQQQQQQKCPG